MKCKCGEVMVDTLVPNPFTGSVIADVDSDEFQETIADELAALMKVASNAELRTAWMNKHFEIPPYPADASNQELIFDLISQVQNRLSRCLWQCESCGRLWLQDKPYENNWRSFDPDDEWKGTSSLESLLIKAET